MQETRERKAIENSDQGFKDTRISKKPQELEAGGRTFSLKNQEGLRHFFVYAVQFLVKSE